ncbi:MAG: 8-amino-7-oxononanoate synthase [Gammaproteobacteria bacterium]
MTSPDRELRVALEARQVEQLYRRRLTLETPQGALVGVGGRACVNFASNDYLGLANHPEVISAFVRAAQVFGVGSGASHLISGHSREHQALEEELAAFTGRPRALLFSTGYMANMGVINALMGPGDLLLQDRLNHASLLDGGFLCRARFERYPHGDLDALDCLLETAGPRRTLIATDGVFSMDGDLAPLRALAARADARGAWLMVDDAHGFGVLGRSGGGVVEELGLSLDEVPILIGTLGKAFGTFGAFVAGSETLIETLIQFGRTYIYTTALPPAVAAATRASLRLLRDEGWRREHLRALIARFRTRAAALGIPLLPSMTPIQPVPVGDDGRVLAMAERLREAGHWVGAIRPPTVPRGTARLRIALSASHSVTQVDALVDALAAAWRALPAERGKP